MKRLAEALIFSCMAMGAVGIAQNHLSARGARGFRVVHLETVLSCADDPLIRRAFEEREEAALLAVGSPQKYGLGAGFDLYLLGNSTYGISAVDPLSRKDIPDAETPFCHFYPQLQYPEAGTDGGDYPAVITIPGETWTLNANELFAHADQFQFESGTFKNSDQIYLSARKGATTIQFLCGPNGLKFYRAIYMREGR